MDLNSFADPAHRQVYLERDIDGFEVEGSLVQTLFSLPGPMENHEQVEGRDDKCPVVLGEIMKEHFRGLLRVMYPL